jgi:hypothetical protein
MGRIVGQESLLSQALADELSFTCIVVLLTVSQPIQYGDFSFLFPQIVEAVIVVVCQLERPPVGNLFPGSLPAC